MKHLALGVVVYLSAIIGLQAAPVTLATPPEQPLLLENTETEPVPAPVHDQFPKYRLGPEDALEITVWQEPDLQKEVLISPDGWLTFPLVGEIKALGKTIEEVRQEITKRLKRLIPEAVVSVSLIRIGSNKAYVIGKVNQPGEYTTGRYVTVMQVLSMAGGLRQFSAGDKIKILRRVNGREIAIPFNYDEVVSGRNLEQNIVLRDGDVVVVP